MRKRIFGLALIAIAVYVDLTTKSAVFQGYIFGQKNPVLFFLYWLPIYNTGVAWSMASSHGTLVACASIVLSIACTIEFFRHPSVIWGLICAGGIANTWDRLVFGAVRDFIALSYGGYTCPIFNLADCYLSLGIFLLLAQQYLGNMYRYIFLGDR